MKKYEKALDSDVITVTRTRDGELTTECYVKADTNMEGALMSCRILMCAAVRVAGSAGISEEDVTHIFDNACNEFYEGDEEDGD